VLTIWMLYTLVVSTLVGASAAVLERHAAARGGSLRLVWLVAFVAALAVVAAPGPSLGVSWSGDGGDGGAFLGGIALVPGVEAEGEGARAVASGGAWLAAHADRWLILGWGLAGVFLLAGWVSSATRTRRRSRKWLDVDLPEGRVLVSPETGPGVIGVLKNRVVLPRWCLGLPARQRDLVLTHEIEHVRARDTAVLAAATLITLAMPWNLPFWAYLRRLRAAVEMDCDARVVERHPGARIEYGELLIAVASRRTNPGMALATFSQDTSTLGRRIRMLSHNSRGISRPQALLLTAGGLLLLAGACLVPGPDRDGAGITGPELAQEPTEAVDEVARQPVFTPMEVRPELRNGSAVQRNLQSEYPATLRDAGIGGTVVLHIFIDDEGIVRNTAVSQSSGYEALDEAAARVAAEMQFSPALNREQRVPVWIEMPITFTTSDSAERTTPTDTPAPEAGSGTAAVSSRDLPADMGAGPTFTPMEVRPELRNGSALQQVLMSEYPSNLRDAGIGGTVVLHIFIDDDGVVRNTEVSQGSGYEALDEAAARVAAEMEFSPALNQDERVPVWIEMPITFTTR
jgi:TonB family protein